LCQNLSNGEKKADFLEIRKKEEEGESFAKSFIFPEHQ